MTIKEITNTIQNKLYSSPDELYAIFHSIKGHFIIPAVTMYAGIPLYRASLINSIDEVTDSRRLSYKPAHLNKTYGRASIPGNSMFYGITATNFQNALCSCLGETCPCLRDPNPIPEHYKVVLSKWNLKKDFVLASIADIDGNNKSAELTEYIQPDEFIALVSTLPNSQDIIDFWRLMSKEFSKRVVVERDYEISAHFTELLLSLNKYDGIIYESVQSTDEKLKESLCVAVPPTIADKYLEFDSADLWEFDFVNIQTAIVPVKTKSNILPKDNNN